MEQRGFFEPTDRDRSGSDLRADSTGRSTVRLTAWSRIAAALAAQGDVIPTQRERTPAS